MRVFLLLLLFIIETFSMEKNKIYMMKAEMQDQSISDTKYLYSDDSISPVKHIQRTDFKYPLEHYESEVLHYPTKNTHDYYVAPSTDQGENLRDSQYEKGAGKGYEEEYYSRAGEKEQTGYNNVQKFDKGVRGKHENEEHEGYYNEKGGDNKNYLNNAKRYASKYDATGGYDGGYSTKSSDSKHDAKTKGYHKQFNKDEYKKKHTFYDESNRKGKFNKYGDYDRYHFDKSGGLKYGRRGNSGYYEDYYGEKGQHDKGHYLDNDGKYKGQKGDSKYYRDYSDYVKHGNGENGRLYSESEKS